MAGLVRGGLSLFFWEISVFANYRRLVLELAKTKKTLSAGYLKETAALTVQQITTNNASF